MANEEKNTLDVLAYNTAGIPLILGGCMVPKEVAINNIRMIAGNYLDGDFKVKIETWVDQTVSEYDDNYKANRRPVQTSLQVWVNRNDPSVSEMVNGDPGNVFVSGVSKYTEKFKKFVNIYGVKTEKGNAIEALGSKRGEIIVCIDPVKLFSTIFDIDNKEFNNVSGVKNTRAIALKVKNLYEGENPIAVLGSMLNGSEVKRNKKGSLTGFVVAKVYNVNGDINDSYRPAFDARRKKL